VSNAAARHMVARGGEAKLPRAIQSRSKKIGQFIHRVNPQILSAIARENQRPETRFVHHDCA